MSISGKKRRTNCLIERVKTAWFWFYFQSARSRVEVRKSANASNVNQDRISERKAKKQSVGIERNRGLAVYSDQNN